MGTIVVVMAGTLLFSVGVTVGHRLGLRVGEKRADARREKALALLGGPKQRDWEFVDSENCIYAKSPDGEEFTSLVTARRGAVRTQAQWTNVVTGQELDNPENRELFNRYKSRVELKRMGLR